MKAIILPCVLALLMAPAARAINIESVPVGNLGNPNDQDYTGFGAVGGVAYSYSIGKYEVTLQQYSAFLNAVAATDTYSLYNTNMASDLNIAGIVRSGSSGSYTYSVSGDGLRPVTYVSWFDAARFTNWMQNGQPVGAQSVSTTEDGAYTLNGAISGIINKNANAQVWIPSEHEWYKAAYYQPSASGGDTDGYWLYTTRTNTTPDNNIGGLPNQANFSDDSGYSVTQSTSTSSTQNYLTPGGAYSASASFYGTFDQGGNVSEWTDSLYFGSARRYRGGSWEDSGSRLAASAIIDALPPSGEGSNIGFRIAMVPEPTSTSCLATGGLFLLGRRMRRF